jgi:ribosomal protein S27E
LKSSIAVKKETTMKDEKKSKHKKREGSAVEVICLKCRRTEILYVPAEEVPKCPNCNIRMTINEVLKEGKSY